MRVEILLSALLAVASWQTPEETHQRHLRLAGEHYDTVMLYRQGQIDAALQRLSANTREDQLAVAVAVYGITRQKKAETQADMHGLAGGNSVSRRMPRDEHARPPTLTPIPAAAARWTVDLMLAAGALQMEAAIMATRQRTPGGYDEAARQIGVADVWFEKYAELTEHDTPARRWKLVIGLMMMAHGAFGRAATLLDPECATPAADVALQLACGSDHEAIAMFPADLEFAASATAHLSRRIRPSPATNPLDTVQIVRVQEPADAVKRARETRNGQLKKAQAMLETVVKTDPRNVEARIRLANGRTIMGHDARAAPL